MTDGPLEDLEVIVTTVTPEMAEDWLRRNTKNRHVTKAKVEQYAGAMRRGEWRFDGMPIRRDPDGNLLDGQHRLLAIVASGVPQTMAVMTGIQPDAQETMDIGRKREFADMLAIRGEPHNKALAAAVRNLHAYERLGVPASKALGGSPPTPQQLFDTLERHPEIRASLTKVGTKGILSLSQSMVATLHYLFSRADPEDADVFFVRLRSGESLQIGDPIHTLRERYIRDTKSDHRPQPAVLAAFAVRAFNAWRAGEKLAYISWRPGGARRDRFPRIHGCPVEPGSQEERLRGGEG